jgi:hypothetical protein
MRTPQKTSPGYARRPRVRPRHALLDAYANDLVAGDRVTPAPLPGPRQLPNWTYGRTGTVVSVGRVRVGVRFDNGERIEYLATRPLIVVAAADDRVLLGPVGDPQS